MSDLSRNDAFLRMAFKGGYKPLFIDYFYANNDD